MTGAIDDILPDDWADACLVGRALIDGPDGGPAVVVLQGRTAMDITARYPTMSHLLERADPAAAAVAAAANGAPLGSVEDLLAQGRLLAPNDLQAVKAAGVTFATSLLERVVEEQARGDPQRAAALRDSIVEAVGAELSAVRPGSPEAAALKALLIERGAWSQYLEVGIGPDAEIFTKCQPMASVGPGARIGIHPDSEWNNPEPEVVLVINSSGAIVGATLGNDVNLRDIEGRSALLLGRAKDNNGSCAIGPFIRLLDVRFTLDDLRGVTVSLTVRGADDNFLMTGESSLIRISRDITDLAAQLVGPNHQYPDGAMLFTGTMFAPVADRDAPGRGFTHHIGDTVEIASPRFGRLTNVVDRTDAIAPWTFGTRALMANLARRGLIG
jgi:fumarylacetoacetate (FAA) hydrolase family protein